MSSTSLGVWPRSIRLLASLFVLTAPGCIPNLYIDPNAAISCNTAADCPDGWRCERELCVSGEVPTPRCGDGIVDADLGEECDCGDDPNDVPLSCRGSNDDAAADHCRTNCRNPSCGDGTLDLAEECDDGNTLDDDGCSAACLREVCGNGRVESVEVCDDGNVAYRDGCSGDCASTEVCGNGYVDDRLDPPELCDCGVHPGPVPPGCIAHNGEPNSICTANCETRFCGNGVLNADLGEVCDDGNRVDGDQCSADCLSTEVCGNAYTDFAIEDPELCDCGVDPYPVPPGCIAHNGEPGSICTSDCQTRFCGNDIINTDIGEVCDDGNQTPGDGCSPDCRSTEICGNRIIDPIVGESCDDGNLRTGDGCSSCCRVEPSIWRGWTPPALSFVNASQRAVAMAYDPNRAVVILVGYPTSGDTLLTWEMDARGGKVPLRWVRTPHAPSNRVGFAMAFDWVRDRLVLFGGDDGLLRDETWEYDGVDWVQSSPTPSPTPREDAVMAFDGTRVALFGGVDDALTRLGDTWVYDAGGWTDLTGTLPPQQPPGRSSAAATYDGRGMLLFGGVGASGNLGDTWRFDDGAWSTPPPARSPELGAGVQLAPGHRRSLRRPPQHLRRPDLAVRSRWQHVDPDVAAHHGGRSAHDGDVLLGHAGGPPVLGQHRHQHRHRRLELRRRRALRHHRAVDWPGDLRALAVGAGRRRHGVSPRARHHGALRRQPRRLGPARHLGVRRRRLDPNL